MSYLDFDYKNNAILACKGDSRNRNKIQLKNEFNDYFEYSLEGKFNGIKIKNFLSNLEQDGLQAEVKFKELLDKNNIPYLYIGQGPFGIERSGVLIKKTKSKRADFLVNIKDMGTILFDAKCRNRIGFHNGNEDYFSLFISELNALHNLQKLILMPVWLAFTDRKQIRENGKPIFYFISISTIFKYRSGLLNFYKPKEEFNEIQVLRIPNSLFTKIDGKIVFEVEYLNIDNNLLDAYAKKYFEFNHLLKKKIKDIIRTKNCYKSNIYKELIKININFYFPYEVNNCIKNLIDKSIIDYQPRQFLKLVGE